MPSSPAVQTGLNQFRSTLSPIYKMKFEVEDTSSSPTGYYIPPVMSGLPNPDEAHYINYYLKEVLCRQYLLADTTIYHFLYDFATTSEAAKDSMCLLSSLHMHCMRQLAHSKDGEGAAPPEADDVHMFYRRVKGALTTRSYEQTPTEGDAMACLHVVSSFLFSGGRGPWPQYLEIAMEWVRGLLDQHTDPAEMLLAASASERFIIRTTMWFDVWGSITQIRQPSFLHIYRALFGNPSRAFIGEDPFESQPTLNMMNVVGCSNTSFRAMAEIATLAYWKADQEEKGSLSIPHLVRRGVQIEDNWLPRSPKHGPSSAHPATEIEVRREIVASVFQASARVYLHMILSRALPNAPEIKEGVEETIAYLRQVPTDEANTRAVVRSVVFAICICGCLTHDREDMEFFKAKLDGLGEEANVFGNCRAVKHLMERVWAMRETSEGDVDWRQVMNDEGDGTLLLV